MIREGDIVRWKNDALRRSNVLAIRAKCSTGKRYRPRKRGDQELRRVVLVSVDMWNKEAYGNKARQKIQSNQRYKDK